MKRKHSTVRPLAAITGSWERYTLVIPVLVSLVFVVIYPFIFGLNASLHSATLGNFRIAPWAGFNNYIRLFQDPLFWNSLTFTLKFTAAAVSIELVLGTIFALFFFLASFPAKRVFFLIMLVPLMIAPIFYGVSLKLALNSLYGVIPWLLNRVGLQIDFFGSPIAAFWTMVGVDVWQWTAFVLLLVYAALQSVPRGILEAAIVDGAGTWPMIWKVLLPESFSALGVAVLLRLIDAFKVFDTIYLITGGGPGVSTRSVSLQIWYYMFGQFDLAKAAAYTVVFAIIVSIVAQIAVRTLAKESVR